MFNNKINPWAGPSSYQDPEIAKEKLLFCGRDREIYDVTKLIDDSLFITLYGMSGIGKTSLMNAGVFPKLRTMQYLPISIRLFIESDEDDVFEDIIIREVKSALAKVSGRIETIPVIQENPQIEEDEYLWYFFATHRFYDSASHVVFPVIVLDQFEEVLRKKSSRSRAESLLSKISYMIDESHAISDCVVDGEEYFYDFNFRFVLSIREDELYRLEDCIDNCYCPALKQSRFRLRSLAVEDAKDIIQLPCPGLLTDKQVDDTIEELKDDDIVNPALLSLYLYLYYEQNGEYTSKTDLFAKYYKKVTKNIDAKAIKYIEDKLISDGGHRNLLSYDDLLAFVPHEVIEHLLKSKILEKDEGYIEFSHDLLCEEAKRQKESRQIKERNEVARRKIIRFAFIIIILISFIFILVLLWNSEDKNQKMANEKMRTEVQLEQAKGSLNRVQTEISKREKLKLLLENGIDSLYDEVLKFQNEIELHKNRNSGLTAQIKSQDDTIQEKTEENENLKKTNKELSEENEKLKKQFGQDSSDSKNLIGKVSEEEKEKMKFKFDNNSVKQNETEPLKK